MNIFPVEIFIARRYLKARKNGIFSLLTIFIAICGIILGVAALVIALAIMSGFQNDIRSKILGIQSHIVITKIDNRPLKDYVLINDKIKINKSVLDVFPFICKQGIIRAINSALSTNVIIKAIDYEKQDNIFNFSKQITVSDISFDGKKISENSIILGNELANSINVNVGDNIDLIFQDDFDSIPKIYKFNVLAIIQSGIYDFDSSVGLIDLRKGQKIFSMSDTITGFDIHTNNFDKAMITALQLQKSLSYPYKVKAWIEMNKNLFSALRLEKIMIFFVLGLIVLVAAFNIISNLLLLGVQRSKEIGIMSAIGFSKFSIAKIFFYEGVIMGLIGTIFGIILGFIVSFTLKYFDIFKLPKGIYYVDKLPIVILPTDIIIVAVSAFTVTVLAGIYPAYQVLKLDPIEIMRHG
jgi:lipoprotein-releasing system permease protein